ncbi:MAG: hypothetical protein ACK4K7_16165, partial [Allosphingosinicella sp.]
MADETTAVRHNGALGSANPADVVLSPDGSRIYVAGRDGAVRVYHAVSGELLATWPVGTRLAGMDVSPDGTFLIALEHDPVSKKEGAGWPDDEHTVHAYRIDVATGAFTTLPMIVRGSDRAFFDVAILEDGTALLSQKITNGWSGWTTLKLLDLSSGQYTTLNVSVRHDTILSRSSDGSRVLVAGSGIFVAQEFHYKEGFNFDHGVQAISADGALVAQHLQGTGVHVYDGSFGFLTNLGHRYQDWQGGHVSGLAFDETGSFLFVLDNRLDRIFQLSTSTWDIVGSIAVGSDVTGSSGQFGNRLLVDPEQRYFTVATGSGLVRVDNPFVSSMIQGTGGDDVLHGTDFADVLDGGSGADRMEGGRGNDIYIVDDAGDLVVEHPDEGIDEVRTSLASYVLPANVENLVGTSTAGQTLRGNALNNVVIGGPGNDLFMLQDGGHDTVFGGAGDDGFYFGGAMTGADRIDGGPGFDQIGLQGDYSAGLMMAGSTMVNIEMLVLLSGSDTRFGDTGGNLYSYNIKMHDWNVPAGQRLTVSFNTLLAGENVTFDGSSEMNGHFLTYGGLGDDVIIGGHQDDGFYFGHARFGANDKVDGQWGFDQLGLQGNYSGVN